MSVGAHLAARLLAQQRLPEVLLIDGRSGSGKTTLAADIAREIERATRSTPQIVGMDELYPGWDGLAEGSASLADVLRTGRYRRYDWGAGVFGEDVTLDGSRMLIVEGCGSITAASIEAASEYAGKQGSVYRVWVESPEHLRRSRALERDGNMFAPHWDRWAAQERAHFARANPTAQANEIVHIGQGA